MLLKNSNIIFYNSKLCDNIEYILRILNFLINIYELYYIMNYVVIKYNIILE